MDPLRVNISLEIEALGLLWISHTVLTLYKEMSYYVL